MGRNAPEAANEPAIPQKRSSAGVIPPTQANTTPAKKQKVAPDTAGEPAGASIVPGTQFPEPQLAEPQLEDGIMDWTQDPMSIGIRHMWGHPEETEGYDSLPALDNSQPEDISFTSESDEESDGIRAYKMGFHSQPWN